MAFFDKHFTWEEAQRELPRLRKQFARIQELVAVMQQAQMETEQIHRLIQSNGAGSNHPDYGPQVAELQALVAEITDKGIQIKDLQRGLIDFPHWRNGEEVYLCWLYGEDDIAYWHTLDGGFAGRNPL